MKLKIAVMLGALVITCIHTNAQSVISGQVKNENGVQIPFATIGIAGTQLSAIADAEGNFRFKPIKDGTYVIHLKSLGFLDKTDTVVVRGDHNYHPQLNSSS